MKQARQLPHPSPKEITLTRVLHALCDPVRLSVVADLAGVDERSASAFQCGVAESTLSHHLKKLRQAGIVDSERQGLWAYYYVRPEAVGELAAWLS